MFKVIQNPSGRIKTYYAPKQKKSHQKEIFLFVMFLSGLICGAVVVRTSESAIPDHLYTLIRNYFDVKAQQSFLINFSNTVLKRIFLLLLLYCVGVCAFGAPLLYAVPAIHGAGIGMISAYLYSAFALKGIGYCALIFYPGEVFFCAVMLLGCSVGIEMTGQQIQCLSGKKETEPFSLRAYTAKYGVFLLLSIGSALLETAMYSVFSGYFQFS